MAAPGPSTTADRPVPAASVAGTTTATALAEALAATWRRWRRTEMPRFGPLGLTPAQARALQAVTTAGTLRMAALAGQLGVVPRSATSVVDALSTAGLVRRLPDPADRRSVLVSATDAGRNLADRLSEVRRCCAEDMFEDLDEPERAELLQLLDRLCRRAAAGAPVGAGGGG